MSLVVVISGSVSEAHRGFPPPFTVTRARLRAGSCRSERCVRPRLAPRPAFPGKSYAEPRHPAASLSSRGWRMTHGKAEYGMTEPGRRKSTGPPSHLTALNVRPGHPGWDARGTGDDDWGHLGAVLFTRSLGGEIVTDQTLTLTFFLPPRQFTGTGWSQAWLGWIINQPRINCWWQITGIR